MKTILIAAIASLGLAFGAGAADEHAGHDHGASDTAVEVPENVQRTMGLKTARAEIRRMRSTIPLLGRFEPAPDARSAAISPVAGRIEYRVRPLAQVKAGEPLFTVAAPGLLARTHEIDALERRLAVYRASGTANAELEAQLAVKRGERAAMLGGASETNGLVTVRAAEDGVVETRLAVEGAWVEAGTQALGLIRPGRLRFKALAAASDAARLADGQPVRNGAAMGTLHLGIGDDTGMIPLFAVFPEGALTARAGERGRVECVTDETETPVPAIPEAAIVRIGLRPTVFIRDPHDADRFVAHPVETGIAENGWVEAKGLPAGAEVVTDGVYELRLALPSSGGKAAGHFHADGKFHDGEAE